MISILKAWMKIYRWISNRLKNPNIITITELYILLEKVLPAIFWQKSVAKNMADFHVRWRHIRFRVFLPLTNRDPKLKSHISTCFSSTNFSRSCHLRHRNFKGDHGIWKGGPLDTNFWSIFSLFLWVEDIILMKENFKIFSKQFEAYGSLGTNFFTFVPIVTI